MDKNKFLSTGLLEQYVLGLTTSEESELVERFADEFPEIQHEIDSMRKALEDYARSNAIPPPKGMKNRILKSIDKADVSSPSMKKRTSTIKGGGYFRYAASFLLAATVIIALLFFNKSRVAQQNYTELAMEYDELQQDCSRLQAQHEQIFQQYAVINDDKTTHVHVRGTDKFVSEALAVVYYNDKDKKAILQLVDFPEPPEDKQYQIWADVEGEMINMGIIDCKMNALQAVKFIDHAESLNITLEPKGGSDHPTVEYLYANGPVSS